MSNVVVRHGFHVENIVRQVHQGAETQLFQRTDGNLAFAVEFRLQLAESAITRQFR